MTTSDTLKSDTALAVQYFELLRKALDGRPIEDAVNLPVRAQRDGAAYVLSMLYDYLTHLRENFETENLASVPVMEFGTSHAKFLSQHLFPCADEIETALSKFCDLESAEIFWLPAYKREPGDYKVALAHLIEFWVGTLSEQEEDEYSDFLLTCKELETIVSSRWFDPNAWKRRQELLRPIILPVGSSKRLRDHMRIRLTEIYQSFVFGQFLASVALCRTLLEFAIIQNCQKLGIEKLDSNGREKKLFQLIEDLNLKNPDLASHAEAIRDQGNRVIHPKKQNIVAIPRVLEDEALDAITHIVEFVEKLYQSDLPCGSSERR